ncbi:MAG: tail fiber domain-containing protein, partial [Aeromonas veronii]
DAKLSAVANAVSASKLFAPVKINGVSFDGSADITITAASPNTLTRGAGLTGSNYNGAAATTWAVAYGSAAGTACQGNDVRLSDARVPKAHTHTIADVTSLQTTLDSKYSASNKPSATDVGAEPQGAVTSHEGKANAHPISGVAGLQTALDGKYSPANKPTAADVGLGNVRNVGWNHGAAADTYAVRDNNADITARLFRSTYADESGISGGLAFRKSTTDNYIRFCNNTGAIRSWLGAAPSGYGLGDYGKSISTVEGNCELRTKSGFFQGSNITGLPTSPHSWNYVFNQAHGNAAGYFGYLAISFDCSKAWIGGQSGGAQKGPYELVKRGDEIFTNGRIEINTSLNPMLEFHMPGKHAVCQYVDASGNFRLGTSNGAGGEVTLRAQFATNGELYVNGNGNFNDVYIRSDRRMKSDLVKVDGALAKVEKLQAYTYNKHKSIEDSEIVGREVGIIAQD